MTCSTCNDYLIQIRKASINYDDTLYWSIMDLYILYNHDTVGDALPAEVRRWCIESGKNKKLRIALCGYDGEHNELGRLGWSVYAWKASRAYGSHGNDRSANNTNRHNERIWFSPACLSVTQLSLFEEAE